MIFSVRTHPVPAVFFNHIFALFVMVIVVVTPTFHPSRHGDTVDTDLLDQQHTDGPQDNKAQLNLEYRKMTSNTVTRTHTHTHRQEDRRP